MLVSGKDLKAFYLEWPFGGGWDYEGLVEEGEDSSEIIVSDGDNEYPVQDSVDYPLEDMISSVFWGQDSRAPTSITVGVQRLNATQAAGFAVMNVADVFSAWKIQQPSPKSRMDWKLIQSEPYPIHELRVGAVILKISRTDALLPKYWKWYVYLAETSIGYGTTNAGIERAQEIVEGVITNWAKAILKDFKHD